MNNESYFYHDFVDKELEKGGFSIKPINEDYINRRLSDCMSFVNGILEEYKNVYTLWKPKPKEWFLNPMNRKWDFSFTIENINRQIILLYFASVYDAVLHGHCIYTDKNYRGFGLAKLLMIKFCQKGLDCGFIQYEGYVDKNNNGSILFHLNIGLKIENIRNNEQLFVTGDLIDIRNRAFDLYKKETNNII